MNHFASIAIDGPAASGKSSVGLRIADQLGYLFLDTGLMYRAVTWAALNEGIDIYDEQRVSKLANSLMIKIEQPSLNDGRKNDIYVNGEDITWKIKEHAVNESVSQVSKYHEVRNVLTSLQRKFASQGNIVMVGRDIGTVVLPDADYKFFLKASVEERSKRRYKEEIEMGGKPNKSEIIRNVKKRDEIDSSRILAPLIPAKDAIIIDTNKKNINQVVKEILLIIKKTLN